MRSIKDTLIWLFKYMLYRTDIEPLAKKIPAPVLEFKTFDKSGWTRCDTGFGFETPADRFEPIEIMRDGWDEPALVPRGWQSMQPAMNIAGLYWRKPKLGD